jgi:hypothetical protein
MRNSLIYETIVIGVLTFLLTFGIYYVMKGNLPQTTKPGYYRMIIGSFLVGALLHLSFEFSGINEKWCKNNFK